MKQGYLWMIFVLLLTAVHLIPSSPAHRHPIIPRFAAADDDAVGRVRHHHLTRDT